ncbi:malonate decarboxylase subunit epsilon [Streptomyces albireticuli]|uniref:Malonyl CoA-acyl carrier protein transacylase n=1 Tax=Streptomyces albireticuli TaxID=1940 RepID=A0A1Z2KYX1_9ACTN|nr:ACP S-malonyltransferase [Streptomyces albireticuli]ARZ67257.1 malonate decarboxylase subunit epsilon [Streptomyces albireticuli]
MERDFRQAVAVANRVTSTAVLAMFPGQGSQRVAMAAHLVRQYPDTAGRMLRLADDVLGLPLTAMCTDGSATDLARTEITQPAILAVSLAVLEVLRSEGGFAPAAVAGHSLGEYTALVAAEVLTPQAALSLVRQRGRLMGRVGDRTSGSMAAIMGLTSAQVEEACLRGSVHGVVQVANYNEPAQTVVSGHPAAVEEAVRLARESGAERVVALNVGAPFHCSLMREIEEEFEHALGCALFGEPRTTVFSSVTGTPVRTAAQARMLLRRQLSGPVRWVEVLNAAEASGCAAFVEVGPGRVLSGFARRAVPGAMVRSTNDAQRISGLLRLLRG